MGLHTCIGHYRPTRIYVDVTITEKTNRNNKAKIMEINNKTAPVTGQQDKTPYHWF